MNFQYPHLLNLLWSAPVLALLLWSYWRWRTRTVQQLGHRPERLLLGLTRQRFWLKNTLLVAALVLLAVAMANPQYGTKRQPSSQKSADVFVVLDLSRSMLATDVSPNRLTLARVFAQKLARELTGNRLGLICFSGDAVLQIPLTTDYPAIQSALDGADVAPDVTQGTAIAAAVELADQAFDPSPDAGRALVLITDAEDQVGDADAVVEEAFKGNGIVTFVAGVGTTTGGNIPERGGFHRDENGQVVVTKLNESLLADLAKAGGTGTPYQVGAGDAAVRQLAAEINNLPKRNITVRAYDERESAYQWLLLPAVMLLLAEGWLRWARPEKM